MPEFFNVLPPEQALQILLDRLPAAGAGGVEHVAIHAPISEALGRITSDSIYASEDLPNFPRSTMDGFALRAADTFGATEGLPAYFNVVGEVPMGQPSQIALTLGQAATCYTGGMLADNADAVVMVENTQAIDASMPPV